MQGLTEWRLYHADSAATSVDTLVPPVWARPRVVRVQSLAVVKQVVGSWSRV